LQPPAIIFRPATVDDAPALGRLGALLVGLHHALDPERFLPAGPGTARGYASYLASEIPEAEVVVLVAEEANTVLGYAYARIEGHDWMSLRGPAGVIHDLVVDPDHRRRGIGRALLERTLDVLAERGAPRVVLATAQRNEAAQRLFASIGFRPTMVEMTREWPA
jgi:ribosomal protein S18 acetylase RimI-like enzyme